MPGTALLLSGGGAKGILQVSYLRAFKDLGFDYDKVYGTSVGALNAALYHQGDLEALEELWLSINNSKVYNANPLNMLSFFSKTPGVYDSKPLKKLIASVIDFKKLRSNPRELSINTTDILNSEPVTSNIRDLSDEEVIQILWASASPPIFFPPVNCLGKTLVDGGVLNNYSMHTALKDGMDTLILLMPSVPKTRQINSIKDVVDGLISTATTGYYKRELGAIEKTNQIIDQANEDLIDDIRRVKIVVVNSLKYNGIGLLDFNYSNRGEMLEFSYKIAHDQLSLAFPSL